MPVLHDYNHFGGYHWETGSVHNFYAYRKALAPHTGKPYSEPLLMGISGGVVMGYFSFAYDGYDPQCNILTRNTFDPLETLLSRLGAVQHLEHTARPDKAEAMLVDTLADGSPAIVWADLWSLPYNALPCDEGMWGAAPIVVYGYDRDAGTVYIADRANVPLTLPAEAVASARGRIKKDKHRLLTLDFPDPDKLARAVRLGIQDCINLYLEKPPRGTANNFGLKAFQFWAKLLTQPKERLSWAKVFAPGAAMYAGLTSAYTFTSLFGKGLDCDGERGAYASFLDEAALLLDNPALKGAADRFRASADAWKALPGALLPDHIPPFARARRLLWERHERFLQHGNAALSDMQAASEELASIRQSMVSDFPLTDAEAGALREQIAEQVMRIHDLEREAALALKEAVAGR